MLQTKRGRERPPGESWMTLLAQTAAPRLGWTDPSLSTCLGAAGGRERSQCWGSPNNPRALPPVTGITCPGWGDPSAQRSAHFQEYPPSLISTARETLEKGTNIELFWQFHKLNSNQDAFTSRIHTGFAFLLLQIHTFQDLWQQSGGNKTSQGYFATST